MKRHIAISLMVIGVCLFSDPGRAIANGGLGISMNGAVGASVINGVNYQFFSLRPELSIGNFGVGLDLSLYFDADGNIRKEDWDQASDAIDKIYYIRYGIPGDPLYVRVGNLAPVTLGYGLMMRRYSNAIEWPSVRRIGSQLEIHVGDIGVETIVGNYREIETPGLVAARVTLDLDMVMPVRFGANVVYDGNQYLGAKDNDGDGVPDRIDLFPGKNDGNHIAELRSILSSGQINQLIGFGDLPDINNPPLSIADLKDPVTEIGIDIGVPIIRTERFNIWTYAQAAQIIDYGRGYAIPGVIFTMGTFHTGAEYRIFEKEFRGDYFDMTYETNRVVYSESDSSYHTRESTLIGLPSAQGVWADMGMTFLGLIEVYGSYQNMSYDGGSTTQSVYASAGLTGRLIPKITTAQVYFQQPSADKLFTTESDGTIVGYKVGYEIGAGVSLIYDNKSIYHDGKPTRIMTIETALTF